MSSKSNWTGERLETFVYNESTVEHLHRYAIASELAAGKTVLDIACGEGYGTHLLAAKATSVTGVDIDEGTVLAAKQKYKGANLEYITGRAEKIPAANESYDMVVSFETLEHLSDHGAMMQEIKRVLKPGGLLLISTPDKKTYSDETGYKNPFHQKELYTAEFTSLLKEYFTHIKIVGQRMVHSSVIWTDSAAPLVQYSGDYQQVKRDTAPAAVYNIALASDGVLPELPASLFNGNSMHQQALADQEKMITQTITYRTGHILLYPFKLIRNLFRK